jgi:dihydrofolate reductase
VRVASAKHFGRASSDAFLNLTHAAYRQILGASKQPLTQITPIMSQYPATTAKRPRYFCKKRKMRRLKLQMNILLDNKWDRGMSDFSIENLKRVDCILHGRKTGEGFIPYWTDVANNPKDEEHQLGKRFAEIPNVIFSNTLKLSRWDNATILSGNIAEEVEKLKEKRGKDIIVYGGNSFVASLIQHDLIDEYYLLINPTAIGNGKQSFNPVQNDLKLTLVGSDPFTSGAVLLRYSRQK